MREIVLTPSAKKNINAIFEFLELKWSLKVKDEFANKLYKTIKIVAKNPESFPASEIQAKYRKCVITKHNTLYYHFNNKHIVVISVFDTRQNPKKIKKIK